MAKTLKVLIVDDSRIFRSLVASSLANIPHIDVIGSVRNGIKALEFIKNEKPDVISLDIEMPEMDGIETLKHIQIINQKLDQSEQIETIMISGTSEKGAATTITALQLGAFDFVSKPITESVAESIEQLRDKLAPRIQAIFETKEQIIAASGSSTATPQVSEKRLQTIPRKTCGASTIKAITIGASTGGPRALANVLPFLTNITHLPIIIVQHMPKAFSASLAVSLDKICRHKVIVGAENQVIEPDHVYIAAGGSHLTVKKRSATKFVLRLDDGPREEGCKPAANVLFRTAAQAYGDDVLAVVLTGMGKDGTDGLMNLKEVGAPIIIQDEATSVVWGMPGNAFKMGCYTEVAPLGSIPDVINRIVTAPGINKSHSAATDQGVKNVVNN